MVKEELIESLKWLAERIESSIKLNSFILFGSYSRGEENLRVI